MLLTAGLVFQLLALGDSYTVGESVSPGERWPAQLAIGLRREGIPLDSVTIIARTGWTTDELETAIVEEAPQGPFDLVTLLIGVNNQYRGRDEGNYREEFKRLLDRAVGLAGRRPRRVVVISIPDWGVTPFAAGQDRRAIGAAIDRFNRVNREEAGQAGVRYVDVTLLSRLAETEPGLTAEDGLHPSGEMYRLWTSEILGEARAALGG